MKRNGENIKRIGGGAMVPAPPSSGSTDKRLPRQMLRSGAKEGKENVVSEKNNNKPVGSKKKKRSLSTQPRSYALRDLSKRGRAQRPGREWYSDLKKFQCQDCDKSFLTESAFRRWDIQCPAGRVFQYRVGSGQVLDKILGSGSGSGRVGVSKIRSGIFGYLFYFRVFPGISGISGYFRVCRVFSGTSGFTHIY